MIRNLSQSLALVLTLATPSFASRPPAGTDDWQLLGRRSVSFGAEKDVIEVGVREGRFDAIRVDVQDGDLEMYNIRVVFGNGTTWSPDTRVSFRERSRSRVIDIPGEARVIRRIEFWYRSRLRRGQATVEVFGRQVHPGGGDRGGWDHIGRRPSTSAGIATPSGEGPAGTGPYGSPSRAAPSSCSTSGSHSATVQRSRRPPACTSPKIRAAATSTCRERRGPSGGSTFPTGPFAAADRGGRLCTSTAVGEILSAARRHSIAFPAALDASGARYSDRAHQRAD